MPYLTRVEYDAAAETVMAEAPPQAEPSKRVTLTRDDDKRRQGVCDHACCRNWLVPVHLPPANRATLNGVYSSAIYFGVGIAALSVLRRVVASELYLYLNLYRV